MVELMPNNIIYQVVIYKGPKDYPHDYVARRWNIVPGGLDPTDEIFVAKKIVDVRSWVKENYPGLCQMDPFSDDDPCIHEVWI